MSDSDALVRPARRPNHTEQAIWPLDDAGVTHEFASDRWFQKRVVILEGGPMQSVPTVSKVKTVLTVSSE